MPIICSGVNRASQEKLVPITRHNGASIGPDTPVMALELAVVSPENGPFWKHEAVNFVSSGVDGFIEQIYSLQETNTREYASGLLAVQKDGCYRNVL